MPTMDVVGDVGRACSGVEDGSASMVLEGRAYESSSFGSCPPCVTLARWLEVEDLFSWGAMGVWV